MHMRVLTLLPMLALTGCATTGGGKLAVCDGKHRRPANPYGTVLPTVPGAASAAPPAAAPAPRPQSSVDPKSVLPCGAHA